MVNKLSRVDYFLTIKMLADLDFISYERVYFDDCNIYISMGENFVYLGLMFGEDSLVFNALKEQQRHEHVQEKKERIARFEKELTELVLLKNNLEMIELIYLE